MPVRPLFASVLATVCLASADAQTWSGLREINPPAAPEGTRITAIVGATLIDGRGGEPLPDAVVVIRGDKIAAVGTRASAAIPPEGERIDAAGLFLLPGMLDAHLHTNDPKRISRLLRAGFTTFRDPGRPLEVYEEWLATTQPMPRGFVTGPHFDQVPHAHPKNAVDLQSEAAVRDLVASLHARGASAIKIYYRLPLNLIRAACEQADKLGIPVTAHLELVRADEAIRAGLDGIEHVTSLGTSLATEEDARKFEAGVRDDNHYREDGRYWLWSRLQFDGNPKVQALLDLMLERGVYLTPTLVPFEVQPGDKDATQEKLAGFAKMREFVGIAARAGVPIVASSHGGMPEANWRELELLVEAGLSPREALSAATGVAARFFGAQDRLGTVEAGKVADLVLVAEDPLRNIAAVKRVSRLMLNGVWLE